jgi:peptidoglycan/LPS O-acetylase OafA/YrhL
VFHANLPVPGGFVAVDAFFVISGFVITRLLLRELQITGRLRLRRFYARRVRRLLPALAVLLVFVAIGSLFLQSPLGLQQQSAEVGIATTVFSANAALFLLGNGGYFAPPAEAMPLLHTWTLAVEEQFYLFFPLVLLAGYRWARRSEGRNRVLITVSAVLAVSLLACVIMTFWNGQLLGDVPARRQFAFYGSPFRAWEFALGAVVAITEPRLARLPKAVGVALGPIGLGLLLFACFSFDSATPFPGLAAVLPTVGAAAMIVAGTVTRAGVPAVLSLRPLTWIGDLSYSWYLWHWPAIVYTRAVWPEAPAWAQLVAATGALGPAWLSYSLVEQRIRGDERITGRRVVRLAAACTLVPVTLFAGLLVSTRFPSPTVRDLLAQSRPHADVVRGCTDNLPSDARTWNACTWRVTGSAGTVMLLGDSNAGQFAEGVAAAANHLGYNATLATYGGCPFADVITHYYSRVYAEEQCRAFVERWVTAVEQRRPALVVLSSASIEYLRPDNGVQFQSPDGGQVARDRSDKARLWQQGLDRILDRWGRAGIAVVLVHQLPHFAFDLLTCPGFRVERAPTRCGRTASRQQVDSDSELTVSVELSAVRGRPNAGAMNLIDEVCTAERCSPYRGGRWLYRDGAHLSLPESVRLAPKFESVLREYLPTGAVPAGHPN